jgi:hypothetical protein
MISRGINNLGDGTANGEGVLRFSKKSSRFLAEPARRSCRDDQKSGVQLLHGEDQVVVIVVGACGA